MDELVSQLAELVPLVRTILKSNHKKESVELKNAVIYISKECGVTAYPDDRAEDIRQSILTFPAVSRTAMTPYGRPGMRPSTFTPLQPLLSLVTLCIFPAVVSSVSGPVPPAIPATMQFELIARPEYFLRGKMLCGMLMVSPVLSMNPSKLARKLRPSYRLLLFTDGSASTSPPSAAEWGLRILDPIGCDTREDWGSVYLDPSSPEFVGASRYTNNSGELTALIPPSNGSVPCPFMLNCNLSYTRIPLCAQTPPFP